MLEALPSASGKPQAMASWSPFALPEMDQVPSP